ncbi:hypothetical protein BASA81_006662 [Batrachochytrium salamandrivorans]|nr:hypothetical protein BASA81_006662 [Batrachochytrium salamandrivorans]
MLPGFTDRAQKLGQEMARRVGEIALPPKPSLTDDAPPVPLISSLKSKLQDTIGEAETKLQHWQTKWNKVDHDDDDDDDEGDKGEGEGEATTNSEENEETFYPGKQLVDFKQYWREQAQAQVIKREKLHNSSPSPVDSSWVEPSQVTISNMLFSSPTATTSSSSLPSFYVVVSVGSQSVTTTRRRPVASNSSAVEWPKPLVLQVQDPFADVQITVYLALLTQTDRAVARAILPLSSLCTGVKELSQLAVRRRTKSFVLHLLPLKLGTRVLARSVDGLQVGLPRPSEVLGTLTVQIELETPHSLLYTLCSTPPNRELAPQSPLDVEVLDEIVLHKRKFRVTRLVAVAADLLRFGVDLCEWKDPLVTLWFLYLDFSVLFFAPAYTLPLFLCMYVVSMGLAKRRQRHRGTIPLYQDQVQQDHPEVPNTMPKKYKVALDAMTRAQYALGVIASMGEKLLLSWQEDALVALIAGMGILIAGLAISMAVFIVLLVPELFKAAVFAWILKLHVGLAAKPIPPVLAITPVVATSIPNATAGLAAWWKIWLQRIPDGREIDHRKLAEEYRVEL